MVALTFLVSNMKRLSQWRGARDEVASARPGAVWHVGMQIFQLSQALSTKIRCESYLES
jgi:hypothetical protein